MMDDDFGETESRRDVAIVELIMSGNDVVPSIVTELTGLNSSRAWNKGDEHVTKLGESFLRNKGLWAVTREGGTMALVAKELLDLIASRVPEIRAAATQCHARVTLSLYWDPAKKQGGFGIPSDTLRRLCEITDKVEVYFPG